MILLLVIYYKRFKSETVKQKRHMGQGTEGVGVGVKNFHAPKSIESPSNHLILCHPLLFLPSGFSSISVISNKSALHIRWPKYWSFSISPSNEYSGLISFWIDWFALLAVQGTLKSLLQLHNLKALILQCSASFMVQLSHPHPSTGKKKKKKHHSFDHTDLTGQNDVLAF